jgi:hypothetical protein
MYGKIKNVPNNQPVYIHIKILPYTKSYPQCPAGTKPCRNETNRISPLLQILELLC